MNCAHCGLTIEEEQFGSWLHVATAAHLCEGYPHFGNKKATPACGMDGPDDRTCTRELGHPGSHQWRNRNGAIVHSWSAS